MIDNQVAAQLLFQHKLATQEQILSVWHQITPENDIGALLVAKGILSESVYRQLLEHFTGSNKSASPSSAPASAPAQSSSSAPHKPATQATQATATASPASISQTAKTTSAQAHYLRETLTHARSQGYSDVHLSAGNVQHVRRGGRLEPRAEIKLTRETMETMLHEALGKDYDLFAQSGDIETILEWPDLGRFRVAALRQRQGFDLTIRLIPQKIRTFEESGLPESCRELCHWAQGLVLVTGPAGCGKTSTLATLVELVNQDRRDHIITIEDPIEIVYQPNRCQITQRQIGRHTQSREAALRAALREDPDIIVISELRDLDTIQLAVSAAETGHLVFGTMNTINATRTIYRLIDSFPPEEQGIIRNMVSESLRGVVSQQLLPRKDGTGVVPAYEVLIVNSAVANMIRKDEAHQLGTAMITGKGSGMVVLDDSLRKLVESGLIEAEEAWSRATQPRDFERYLNKR